MKSWLIGIFLVLFMFSAILLGLQVEIEYEKEVLAKNNVPELKEQLATYATARNNSSMIEIEGKWYIIINKSFYELQGYAAAKSIQLICSDYKSTPIADVYTVGENHLIFPNHSCNDDFYLLITMPDDEIITTRAFSFYPEEEKKLERPASW